MTEDQWSRQGKTWFFTSRSVRMGVYLNETFANGVLEQVLSVNYNHFGKTHDHSLDIPVRVIRDIFQELTPKEVQELTNKLELRAEEIIQLERDLEDEKRAHGREHTRADTALLDLKRDVERGRADVRHQIVRYLDHLADTSQNELVQALIRTWSKVVRDGADVRWEAERAGKLPDAEVMLPQSWAEHCIMMGHTHRCASQQARFRECDCGAADWEKDMEAKKKRTKLTQESADPSQFQPGVYRHYKGGLYHALFVGQINELLDPPVLAVAYLSLTTGKWHFRPFNDPRFDSWTDTVRDDGTGLWEPRFVYVGSQPLPEPPTTP